QAHSAGYHALSLALRKAQVVPRNPDDVTRAAFVERLAIDFPEVADVARTIGVPRVYVPPSPAKLPPSLAGDPETDDGSTLVEPALARAREQQRAEVIAPPPDTQDDPGRATPLPSVPTGSKR